MHCSCNVRFALRWISCLTGHGAFSKTSIGLFINANTLLILRLFSNPLVVHSANTAQRRLHMSPVFVHWMCSHILNTITHTHNTLLFAICRVLYCCRQRRESNVEITRKLTQHTFVFISLYLTNSSESNNCSQRRPTKCTHNDRGRFQLRASNIQSVIHNANASNSLATIQSQWRPMWRKITGI